MRVAPSLPAMLWQGSCVSGEAVHVVRLRHVRPDQSLEKKYTPRAADNPMKRHHSFHEKYASMSWCEVSSDSSSCS
jgi:hypothetical protein